MARFALIGAMACSAPASPRPETYPACRALTGIERRRVDGVGTGVVMDSEDHLLHAAKWLLLAVESADPGEQAAILNAAEVELDQSERTRNSTLQPQGEAA
jgi:hypothetical protein